MQARIQGLVLGHEIHVAPALARGRAPQQFPLHQWVLIGQHQRLRVWGLPLTKLHQLPQSGKQILERPP